MNYFARDDNRYFFMYTLKLENFEGPFSILLKLLDEKKLDIKDVSLVAVTDQFIEFIERRENICLKDLASFLSIAAHLLLLKSKAVLPMLEISEEEEEDLEVLKERLEKYRQIQILASQLREFLKNQGEMFSRDGGSSLLNKCGFYPPEDLTAENLKEIFESVIKEYENALEKEKQILPEENIREIISLEERIKDLRAVILRGERKKFSYFVKGKTSPEIVVSFLAVLELVKQNVICVCQQDVFGEIEFGLCVSEIKK